MMISDRTPADVKEQRAVLEVQHGPSHYTMAGSPAEGRALNEEALAFADQIGTTLYFAHARYF